MKKAVFGVFCTLICSAIFFLSGCGQPKKEPNTLVIWHWMTDRQKAFEELARQYEQLTNIQVRFELYAPSGNYTQKVIASAQAKILPDIYGILDNKETFGKYVKYGFIADLTEAFKANNAEWENSLFDKALSVNKFEEGNIYGVKPGIYGVPLDVTNIQMIYNKALLAKSGFTEPPKTFSEFLQQAHAMHLLGISPFVSGWGEVWLIDVLAWNYAFNIMGEEKVMLTYKGEVPYTDPAWVAVFQIFEQMRDNDVLIEGIISKPNKEAEQDFALGRAAFTFNGSWGVNTYKDLAPDLDYVPMLPPPVNPVRKMIILGGAGSSFVVNGHSPNKDKAIAFLQWMTSTDAQVYLAKETNNLPSNRKALAAIPANLSGFADDMDNTSHPTVWPYNENPRVSEAFLKGIQAIILGEKTAQQAAEQVQAVKQREMEKQSKEQ